ncbi:MAG: PDDEXK family nuclease [Paludibacteraceae bacterium]
MKSIDTLYNGNYFRSRLEARWAYFFDQLGVKYEYEPEGFESEGGDRYLPDFYLPDTYLRNRYGKGVYVEIKPANYEHQDIRQSEWFTKNLVLFKGMPFENIWTYDGEHVGGYQLKPGWDNCMFFWACGNGNCRATKIEFSEGNYDFCPECGSSCDAGLLEFTANTAIMKRFEHGDND